MKTNTNLPSYHPRYTYKRLTGALHVFTWGMILTIVMNPRDPNELKDQKDYYGYSYLLAWISFIISLLASIAFFTWSKKRKHLAHDLEIQLK